YYPPYPPYPPYAPYASFGYMPQQSPQVGYNQPYAGTGYQPFAGTGGIRGIGNEFYDGRSDITSLTPLPANVLQRSQEPMPQMGQPIYDREIAQTKMKLLPVIDSVKDATEVSPGKQELGSVSGTGYEETVSYEVEQQQKLQEKQQLYNHFNTAEKGQVKTDIIDYGSGAKTDGNEMSQLPQEKYEQPEPEAGYDGAALNANSNVAFEASLQQSKIAAAPIVSKLTKTSVKNDDHERNMIFESRSIETDDSTCNDPTLKAIIVSTLNEYRDNLDAARNIENEASKRFGGRFNSIVSDSEFAYVNWYGKRNCQLQINGRHSLTWED
ncbi:unnamed protein product, partial [Onchocerca ochengi]